MNYKEHTLKRIDILKTLLTVADELPDEMKEQIYHVSDCNYISFNDTDYDTYILLLHKLRENATVSLKHYFMSCGRLCVVYYYNNVEVLFYITNPEESLRKISKGKCKIIDRQETTQGIVCEPI